MKQINSKDNKIYKLCKQLASRKYRDSLQKYIAEGPNLVEEAFKNAADVECVVVCEGYENAHLLPSDFVHVVQMNKKLFDEISDTVTTQSIIAVIKKPDITMESFFSSGGSGNFVLLDRLQDPGNIGTIIRTADAAGYKGVVAVKGCGDIYSSKTVRAAAGSVFRMPVLFAETPLQAVGLLRQQGKKLIAACLDTEHRYYDADLRENIALIIGNEGNGICEELIAQADIKVRIPMNGSIESLNAAVAAGILMYESIRQQI